MGGRCHQSFFYVLQTTTWRCSTFFTAALIVQGAASGSEQPCQVVNQLKLTCKIHQ